MLSIGTLSAGQGFYYTDLAREQYYLDGGEPPGHWSGQAAERLGLSGEVGREELHQVLQGFGLEGEKLVQNAGRENRQAGLDLTFSADKSVSVLWGLGDDQMRAAIERAHGRAVDAALDYLQSQAAWTRRGHGGHQFEPCELLFARFNHGTSRAGDPNLHTHVLVPNVGLREDGTTAALWNHDFYQHKMAAGAVYRAALAHELGPRGLNLPLKADSKRGLFSVASVPKEVIEFFSKRRAQIEAELRETGYSTQRAADSANLRTRDVKGHESLQTLRSRWRSEALGLGFTPETLPAQDSTALRPSRPLQSTAKEQAERLAGENGTFRAQDLIRAVASHAMDGHSSPAHLIAGVDSALRADDVLVVGEAPRGELLTTKKQLDSEVDILGLAAKMNARSGAFVGEDRIASTRMANAANLDSLERKAAFEFLTSPKSLKVLAGVAGTGKTTLLKAAREAWETQGYRVVGMALAGKAARELSVGAGIDSETVRMRQLQLAPTTKEVASAHLRGFLRAARYGGYKGFKESTFERLKLDSRSILVIDESSMLSLEDTRQMLKLADEAGASVVLVGDERQLPAIDAVSPFESIGRHIGRFELRGIKRQEEEWMRSTVTAFADGDSRTGLSLLREHGALHISGGGPSATQGKLVEDWMKSECAVDERLVLTGTRQEASELNSRIQAARRATRATGFLTVKLGSGEVARRGERVLFERNKRSLGVRNGDLGTIVRIHRPVDASPFNKGTVTIALDGGGRVRVNLNNYEHLSLGYALTTHRAQGSTVDHALVYTTPERASRDMVYVQASRARSRLGVYCPGHDLGEDLAELSRSLERDSTFASMATERAREAHAMRHSSEEPPAPSIPVELDRRRRHYR